MNLGDYDGRTALHLAAAEGHLRCVRFLIDVCKVRHDVKDRYLFFKALKKFKITIIKQIVRYLEPLFCI